MRLLDRLRTGRDGFGAVELSPSTVAACREHVDDAPDALRVRPARDGDGIQRAESLLTALHEPETSRFLGRNQSAAHAFELRYLGDTVDFQFVPADRTWLPPLERQLQDAYPNAQIERDRPTLLDVDTGMHVAGATLELDRYTLLPIRHHALEGFDRDPFGSIISELVGIQRSDEAPAQTAVQVMFRPEPRSWTDGINGGPSLSDITHELKEPSYERHWKLYSYEWIEKDPSPKEREAAKIVGNQHGEKGWGLAIRILSVSTDPDVARRRAELTSRMYENYYLSSTQQSFTPAPLRGEDLRHELRRAIGREWQDTEIVKAAPEVAGVVHIPDESINSGVVDWALAAAGTAVPPRTPRFGFDVHESRGSRAAHENPKDSRDAAGVGGQDASREAKQAAMLADADPGDPFWYGWGARSGTEAGVREATLATHQFVGGSTGQGKTTLLKHLARQVMSRGDGALVYDPKGRDAPEIASLVPDDREDDLVFIEIGGDRDRQVGFNFLEVPVDADPDAPAFSEAVESLTDDLTALLAQSGGDAEYWGPRMDRIARNLIRGMAKSGRDCTLLDMYYALLDSDRRHAYADMLSDERIEWIEDYAREHLAGMDDSDLEPLVGRLQQWIENDLTREIVSYPTSTTSIEEAVAEGRIIIVQDTSTSDTVGTMIATALLRRIWVAIREQTTRADCSDPPPFYALLDEFNEIASTQSSIAQILSDARAFGLSITAACQDLSAQLDDEILSAIEGQCNTFLTFNPGRSGDAKLIAKQHSRDIDDEDLLNLSKYRLYMRTHTDREELTETYKVRAFPPLDEVTDLGRSEAATETLIESSLERYGAARRTSEDMKRDSVFYDGPIDDETETESGLSPAMQRALTIKAVFDESLVQERTQEGVPAGDVVDRLDRYLPAEDSVGHNSVLWSYVEQVPADELDRTETDDAVLLRATELGRTTIFETGKSAAAGTGKHRLLLRDAYPLLTRLGMEVSLAVQAGTRDVDGVGRLRESFDPEVDFAACSPRTVQKMLEGFADEHPLLAELMDGADITLEAETTTQTHPGLTIKNLAKAYENGQRCLFLTREDAATTVWELLTDPPLVKGGDPGGDHTLYNDTEPVRIDGDEMQRPGDAHATVWRYDSATDEYVLADSDGEVHARFPSASAIYSDADRYPEVDEGRTVYAPVVPERLFGSELPTTEEWDVLVVPREADDGVEPAEALRIVQDGESRPLSALVGGGGGGDDADVAETLERIKQRRWG